MVLAGEGHVIMEMDISSKYRVVIGIPKDYTEQDSKTLLGKELAVMNKFIRCGKKFGPIIAYKILHTLLPAMIEKN